MLAVFTVTNLNNSGAGSLREAIAMANGAAGPDEVQFSVTGNLRLTSGEIGITEALTITGPGRELLTIDAQQSSRIFNITASNGNFTISGLTLTGGRTFAAGAAGRGGAIRTITSGLLTVFDSAVTGSRTSGEAARGGGIASLNGLAIINSTVSGNTTTGANADGGGVYATLATLTNSRISDNRTTGENSAGGGVFSTYRVTLTNSTVSGNSTVMTQSGGGGIHSDYFVTLTNSTVSGNSTLGTNSDGGGISANDDITLTNSTVSGNSSLGDGGGIAGFLGDVTLIQSTIADNHAATGGGVFVLSGGIESSSSIIYGNFASNTSRNLFVGSGSIDVNYTLIGNTIGLSPGDLAEINAGAGNLLNFDPLLGPLALHGGLTETHALRSGSPAIDKGDPGLGPNPADFDQRGAPFLRVVNGAGGLRADMGAYERQSIAGLNLVVDNPLDEVDGDLSTGRLTLREAIGMANGSVGTEMITFHPGVFAVPRTILLELGDLDVTETLTIEGPGREMLTLDGQQKSRIFNHSARDGDFTISGMTLTGGRTTTAGEAGGAVFSVSSPSTLTIEDSRIIGNSTTNDSAKGGGVFASGNVVLERSTITGNSTAGSFAGGGGIFSFGTVNVNYSTVTNNSTGGFYSQGGGIYGRSVTIQTSLVQGNSTHDHNSSGGGIFTENALTISSIVSANSTSGDDSEGGGIFAALTVMTSHSTLSGNSTGGIRSGGGGISTLSSAVSILNSTISGNVVSGASSRGGGINASYGDVTLIQSTLSGNSTEGNSAEGGGIWARGAVSITDSAVTGNHTVRFYSKGGGIRAEGDVTLTRSTVSGNRTEGRESDGGGIWNMGAVDITNSTLSGNSTTGPSSEGGALRTYFDPLTITQSTISGNSTSGSGSSGGAILAIGAITVDHSTITDNHAIYATAPAGGIWNNNDPITIHNSILAGNTAGAGFNDIFAGTGTLTINHSLIGTGISPDGGIGNNTPSNNPMLGPLANNGGPTETRAPMPGSPAIDAGGSLTTPPPFDQRGAPFVRVFDDPSTAGSGIDIGAVEVQPVADSADFDSDGDVDGRDFLFWQRGFGTPSAVKTDGDADNDMDVDGDDLTVWQGQYGTVLAIVATLTVGDSIASESLLVSATEDPLTSYRAAIDAAMAMRWFEDAVIAETDPFSEPLLVEKRSFDSAFADHTILPREGIPEEVDFGFLDSNDAEEAPDGWLTEELLEHVFG